MTKSALVVTLLCFFVAATPARAEESQTEMINDSVAVLKSYFTNPQWEGVKNMVGAAKAIVIAPSIKSGSLILGYERGTALLLVRKGEDWSDPAFISLSEASVGFQAGAKDSEVLMIILTRDATKKFIDGVFQVSGSGSFALGNLGIGASGSGSLSGGMEILTVETSSGLELSSNLGSMDVSPNEELNKSAYGDNDSIKAILADGGKLKDAVALRKMLTEAVKQSRND
jgi:SH3 domain-containing YSC84-like protein 1